MAYFILLNARQSYLSECKLKGRWLGDMYKYKLTHGTPYEVAFFHPHFKATSLFNRI
jgi:hypothetical protein